jgi:hypothetical protein
VSDVKFYHEKLLIFLIFFSIWNYGNHGTLFFFDTHDYQETQIKNPFDSILSFGLVKDFQSENFYH